MCLIYRADLRNGNLAAFCSAVSFYVLCCLKLCVWQLQRRAACIAHSTCRLKAMVLDVHGCRVESSHQFMHSPDNLHEL